MKDMMENTKVADKQGPVTISEKLVREIAANLGVSAKLEEALVESIFGHNWDGKPPEGVLMHTYANRDRLVAFVSKHLSHLWSFERE